MSLFLALLFLGKGERGERGEGGEGGEGRREGREGRKEGECRHTLANSLQAQ
jgi:hypothetical protein